MRYSELEAKLSGIESKILNGRYIDIAIALVKKYSSKKSLYATLDTPENKIPISTFIDATEKKFKITYSDGYVRIDYNTKIEPTPWQTVLEAKEKTSTVPFSSATIPNIKLPEVDGYVILRYVQSKRWENELLLIAKDRLGNKFDKITGIVPDTELKQYQDRFNLN
ncbi:MAG: hypothetical protein M1433_02330 [Candidatus Parvarchaeota archaeon]|nr:hypothetical protein [Candidatus Parvarchaeota archaeon]